MKNKKHIKSFNEASENLNISDVSDSLIRRQGTFHMDVDIIKYDGTNKDFIINKLNIKSHIPSYFKNNPSYFIIPGDGDWFILDKKEFKRKVTLN